MREPAKPVEDLNDDIDIEKLAQTVSIDNHNKLVHDILNQNNSRISSSKKKPAEKTDGAQEPKKKPAAKSK